MKCFQLLRRSLLLAWLITTTTSVYGKEWEFRNAESQDGKTSVSLGWLNECVPVGVDYIIRLRLLVTSSEVSTFGLTFYYDWGDGNFHSQVLSDLPVGLTYEFEQKHIYNRADTYRQDAGGEVTVQGLTVPLSRLWRPQVGENSCTFPSMPTSPSVNSIENTVSPDATPIVPTMSSPVMAPGASPVFATNTPTSAPSHSFSRTSAPVKQPTSSSFMEAEATGEPTLPTPATPFPTTEEQPPTLLTSWAAKPFTTTTATSLVIIIISCYFTS